jgi:uncharacterized protein
MIIASITRILAIGWLIVAFVSLTATLPGIAGESPETWSFGEAVFPNSPYAETFNQPPIVADQDLRLAWQNPPYERSGVEDDKFPARTTCRRICDFASVLAPSENSRLESLTAEVAAATTAEIVVVTIDSLGGNTVDDYANQLFNAWAIGRADTNNGVLFLIAPRERRTRIEVGYGLEPLLTDGKSGEILDTDVLPSFKAGRMSEGIVRGTVAIASFLQEHPDEARGVKGSAPGFLNRGNGSSQFLRLVQIFMGQNLAPLTDISVGLMLLWFWRATWQSKAYPILLGLVSVILLIAASALSVGFLINSSHDAFFSPSLTSYTKATALGAAVLLIISVLFLLWRAWCWVMFRLRTNLFIGLIKLTATLSILAVTLGVLMIGLVINSAHMSGAESVAAKFSGSRQWTVVGLVFLLVTTVGNIFSYRRFRPHRCPKCSALLSLWAESREHLILDPGEQVEQALHSVDYDVWHCRKCRHTTKIANRSMFSGYGRCGKCGRRTFKISVTVLERATTSSTGRSRIDGLCRFCNHETHDERIIPMVIETSSSSDSSDSGSSSGSSDSSSSSDSSGGSSGGGGASRDW